MGEEISVFENAHWRHDQSLAGCIGWSVSDYAGFLAAEIELLSLDELAAAAAARHGACSELPARLDC